MIKAASLQAALYAAPALLKHIRNDPANLSVIAETGRVHASHGRGLAFEYRYDVVVGVFGFPGHADEIMVPILCWVADNQRDLIANPDTQARGIEYWADPIDDKAYDLYVRLPLTEGVRFTKRQDGGFTIEHIEEEPLPDEQVGASPLHRLYLDDQLIATCAHPVA